jgi:hypothetical protein
MPPNTDGMDGELEGNDENLQISAIAAALSHLKLEPKEPEREA